MWRRGGTFFGIFGRESNRINTKYCGRGEMSITISNHPPGFTADSSESTRFAKYSRASIRLG